MKKIAVLFFLTLFSFVKLIGNPDIVWGTPTTISGSSASDPHVVMDPNGNVTAAWVQGTTIMASFMPVGTQIFGTATQISGAGTASKPHLGVDSSGNVTAIWLESGAVSSASLPFNGSWTTPAAISSTTASTPVLAVDSTGNAIAVWVRSALVETATKLSGGSWGTVNTFSSTTNSSNPTVAIGGTKAIIVWHNVTGTGSDALPYSTATVGGAWSTVANVFPVSAAVNHNYPHVVMDSNSNAYLLWYRYNTQGSAFVNVQAITSSLTSGAASWAIPTIFSDNGVMNPANLLAKIMVDTSGDVFAVWTNSLDGGTFLIHQSSKPLNGSWAPFQPISGDFYVYQFDISTNSLGNGMIVYMFFDGTNESIVSQEANITGIRNQAFFSPQAAISTGTDNGFPRTASTFIGTTLNAVTVWLQSSGGNTTVQASLGSRAALNAPTGLSVTQSSNNFGVFTEFFNTLSWTNSTSPNLAENAIYRNGVLITQTDPTVTSIVDHNQVQNGSVTYGVATFDTNFAVSPTATVSFP